MFTIVQNPFWRTHIVCCYDGWDLENAVNINLISR